MSLSPGHVQAKIDRLIPYQFKPGQSGHPGGRPVDARSKLTKAFLNALMRDFEIHGEASIARCREEYLETYIRAIIALCPREVEVKRPLQEIEDGELLAHIRALERFLATEQIQGGVPVEGQPAGLIELQALPEAKGVP